eukprot:4018203-Pyramimonas_sp.AAC.1
MTGEPDFKNNHGRGPAGYTVDPQARALPLKLGELETSSPARGRYRQFGGRPSLAGGAWSRFSSTFPPVGSVAARGAESADS